MNAADFESPERIPANDNKKAQNRDVEVLARTLWGEARGEGLAGMEAVAMVVMNRVKRAKENGGRHWWGTSVESVCLKPWQFSCWNPNDPNRTKLEQVTAADPHFRICLRIARRAVAGTLKDGTHGATHYHHRDVAPYWSHGRAPAAEIGHHLFYNDVG